MRRRISVTLLAAGLAMGVLAPPGVVAASPTTNPAQWQPWLLSSADQFRLPAPPADGSATTHRELRELRELQAARTKKIERRIRHWNVGPATLPWTRVALNMIVKWRPRPPFSARALGLFHTGLYDALIAAADSRSAYDRSRPEELDERIDPVLRAGGSSYAPERVVIAGAAASMLTYLFPSEDSATFSRLARRAATTRLQAGVNYRSDVERALDLGESVAGLFIARGQSDGSTNSVVSNPRPAGDQYWERTPPGFEPNTGGPVGTWTPWLAESAETFRTGSEIPGPYGYGSPEFMAELDEVLDVTEHLTQRQGNIAVFWDDGPGTYTPTGHWNDIAIDLVRNHGTGTRQTARIFAYLGVTEADGAIAVFEAKYHWWSIRPITVARRLCENATRLCTKDELAADPSLATYPSWDPYLITPPFPAYPGGHSTFSGAAGRVLGHFFPESGQLLDEWAEEAAMSRLYGGIHFRSDNDAGLILGRYVAQLALDRAAADGSAPRP